MVVEEPVPDLEPEPEPVVDIPELELVLQVGQKFAMGSLPFATASVHVGDIGECKQLSLWRQAIKRDRRN